MYIKKKRKAGCASRQLRGLVVNCAQGQVWESLLILTSIGLPTPDVKKTIRDPSIVKLIWASNLLNEIDNWWDLTEKSAPPNRAYGMTWIAPVCITLSRLAFGSCTSKNPVAQRNSGLVPSWELAFCFVIPFIPEMLILVRARPSGL